MRSARPRDAKNAASGVKALGAAVEEVLVRVVWVAWVVLKERMVTTDGIEPGGVEAVEWKARRGAATTTVSSGGEGGGEGGRGRWL
jgi:hypothetical protein